MVQLIFIPLCTDQGVQTRRLLRKTDEQRDYAKPVVSLMFRQICRFPVLQTSLGACELSFLS